MNELRARSNREIRIAIEAGELKGSLDAIASVLLDTSVQMCIVDLIRYSMQFDSWKRCKPSGHVRQPIRRAVSVEGTADSVERVTKGRVVHLNNAAQAINPKGLQEVGACAWTRKAMATQRDAPLFDEYRELHDALKPTVNSWVEILAGEEGQLVL